MRAHIGTQLIVATGLVTALTIGALAGSSHRAHRAGLMEELHRSSDQLGETIKAATLFAMLEDRRDDLRRQIDTIGRQAGIKGVRVFNKEGRIAFSSDPHEIDRVVNKRAEACYACHVAGQPLGPLPMKDRARTFTTSDGRRFLGMITPIQNKRGCSEASCHAHKPEQTVLGVLDITMSLDQVDRELDDNARRMGFFAVVAILATSVMLWWLNRRLVVRPVEALVQATRRVAEGDLTTQVPVTAAHEIGQLGAAFNAMTARLAESRREVVQADKLASIGQLAAGVAHEINNPLTGVLTYASFLLKRADDTPEIKADLEVVVRETKRCREIVKGLLDFARRTPPKRVPTELNKIVSRALAIVENPSTLRQVKLEVSLGEGLPAILADENQIQQVVVNLLLNAADAGHEGGRIRVRTRQSLDHRAVEVEVDDDGSGISRANLERIFEPFFSTKGARGTGLGLAVSWGIVEEHQGTIEVASEEGKGSCFTVRLPAAPSASGDPGAKES
jgi:two-component system NtrC family sensor kinase